MITTITRRLVPRRRSGSRPLPTVFKTMLIATLAAVSLAACGTEPSEEITSVAPPAAESTTTTETATTEATIPTPTSTTADSEQLAEAAVLYFESLAGDRSEAAAFTVPDSPADRYATYFQTIGEAQLANADAAEPITMEMVGDTVELTTTGQTAVYADIVVADDLVESFTIDGNQIGDQVSIAPAVQSGPLSVERAVAYRTGGGLVITTMVITNTGDEAFTFDPAMADYANSSGTPFEIFFAIGATEIQAGEVESLAWIWDDSDLAGTVTAQALPASDPSMPIVLQVVFG